MTVRREGHKLCVRYKVRGYHVDVNGHVNNAWYLHYLEDARDDFLEHLNISLDALVQQGILVFIAETRVRYRSPAVYGDQLDVWGWLCELRRAKSTWHMEIRRAGSDELLAEAWVHVAFVSPGRKILPVPASARPQLESVHLPEPAAK